MIVFYEAKQQTIRDFSKGLSVRKFEFRKRIADINQSIGIFLCKCIPLRMDFYKKLFLLHSFIVENFLLTVKFLWD